MFGKAVFESIYHPEKVQLTKWRKFVIASIVCGFSYGLGYKLSYEFADKLPSSFKKGKT